MKYSCIIALAFLWIACGRSGSTVLEPEKMKLVMWDMLRADEVASLEGLKDTVPNNLLRHAVEKYGQVFAVHHITREQFYDSYRYYQEHPEEHKLLMDSLQAFGTRVKEQREKLKTAKSDSLQKASQRPDSLAVKRDSSAVSKDAALIKDSADKLIIKEAPKSALPPIRDTGRKLPGIPPRIDSGRRKFMMPKFKPDVRLRVPGAGRSLIKQPS